MYRKWRQEAFGINPEVFTGIYADFKRARESVGRATTDIHFSPKKKGSQEDDPSFNRSTTVAHGPNRRRGSGSARKREERARGNRGNNVERPGSSRNREEHNDSLSNSRDERLGSATSDRRLGSGYSNRPDPLDFTSNNRHGSASRVRNERYGSASSTRDDRIESSSSIRGERIGSSSSNRGERLGSSSSRRSERVGSSSSRRSERIGSATHSHEPTSGSASNNTEERSESRASRTNGNVPVSRSNSRADNERDAPPSRRSSNGSRRASETEQPSRHSSRRSSNASRHSPIRGDSAADDSVPAADNRTSRPSSGVSRTEEVRSPDVETASKPTPKVVDVNSIYKGDFEAAAQINKHSLKVFICSNYTDSTAELSYLEREIYPKLQKVCWAKGIEFNVVDLRYGHRNHAVDHHLGQEICLQQIDKCFEESIDAPCFIFLSFDKYGSVVLPRRIEASEFDIITSAIEDKDAKEEIETWYKKDENAIPAQYILQSISSQMPELSDDLSIEEKDNLLQRWHEIEVRILQNLKTSALAQSDLTSDQQAKWTTSLVEQQVVRAISENPNWAERSICLQRNISNLPSGDTIRNDDRALLEKYVDVTATGDDVELDSDAQEKVTALRDHITSKGVATFEFNVSWSEGGVTEETHADYLAELGETFQREMERRISAALEQKMDLDRVAQEAATHASNCFVRYSGFHGRTDLVEKGLEYLKVENLQNSKTPLVLHGVRGAGKSSLISAFAVKSRDAFLSAGKDAVSIIRFCGTTQDSSNGRSLLWSICHQIARSYDDAIDAIPKDFEGLQEEFPNYLTKATAEKPLLLFIDSLAQLSDDHQARTKPDWIPENLPESVYLVVSTFDEEGDCLGALKEKSIPSQQFLEVPSLSKEDASAIMAAKFSKADRTLQGEQMGAIKEAAAAEETEKTTPLRLNLLFNMASKLASYTSAENVPNTVGWLVNDMFERLEKQHGEPVVAGFMRLLVASRCGLSEATILDILSADETLVDSIVPHKETHTLRVPYNVLSQLRADLGELLTDRKTYGRTTLDWDHSLFLEAAHSRYLKNEHFISTYRSIMLYFSGKHHTEFPSRQIRDQPLYWEDETTGIYLFNISKLVELPNALRNLAMESEESFQLALHSLCNLELIAANCEARTIRGHISVLEQIASSEVLPDKGVTRLQNYLTFLRENLNTIEEDSRSVLEQALVAPAWSEVNVDATYMKEENMNITPWAK